MADLNTPLDSDDRVLVVRRNSDGVGEPGSMDATALLASIDLSGFVPNDNPAAAITDVTVTGVYADDDSNIETAINSILAVLRTNGLIAET